MQATSTYTTAVRAGVTGEAVPEEAQRLMRREQEQALLERERDMSLDDLLPEGYVPVDDRDDGDEEGTPKSNGGVGGMMSDTESVASASDVNGGASQLSQSSGAGSPAPPKQATASASSDNNDSLRSKISSAAQAPKAVDMKAAGSIKTPIPKLLRGPEGASLRWVFVGFIERVRGV